MSDKFTENQTIWKKTTPEYRKMAQVWWALRLSKKSYYSTKAHRDHLKEVLRCYELLLDSLIIWWATTDTGCRVKWQRITDYEALPSLYSSSIVTSNLCASRNPPKNTEYCCLVFPGTLCRNATERECRRNKHEPCCHHFWLVQWRWNSILTSKDRTAALALERNTWIICWKTSPQHSRP